MLLIFSGVIIFFIFLRWFHNVWPGWDRNLNSLFGKTVIVTGSNTGIGFATALYLAKLGARVILACRNNETANEARKKIINETGNLNVAVEIIDFESLASVRQFAQRIKQKEERLDILVNNAGAIIGENDTTKDGLNMLMQVNYFGMFLLTLLLLDLLKKSAPSRMVNLSSIVAHLGNNNPMNLNASSNIKFSMINKLVHYGNTKLCIILFTNELARRLKGTEVTVNSVHPGIAKTEIYRKSYRIIKILADAIFPVVGKSTEEGAKTVIYAAASKDLNGISGEYFDNCKIGRFPSIPRIGRNERIAKDVWENTIDSVKLTDEEKNKFLDKDL